MLPRLMIPCVAAVFGGACSEKPHTVEPVVAATVSANDAVKSWENSAPAYWNGVARQLVGTYRLNALQAIRNYSIVSVAQYNAAIAAERGAERGHHPSVHAAISAASVVALSYLHADEASALEGRLAQYLEQRGWPGGAHADNEAGAAIGRAIAEQVVARARTDRFNAPWTDTVPKGPGKWFSATAPVGATVGQAKTYFLESGSQFRPAPPPAFGSPEFNAAVGEVRHISDTRTPQQTAIAVFWNLPAGTHQPPGYWNEQATTLAAKYRLNERETAHTLALMNMVAYDAIVASHEAKFHYWLLRPIMADPGITLPIGMPNFPSYPSNHATISAGMARVLGARFPSESAHLDELAVEAAWSRVYGGIHYWFDGEAGIELGRKVAAWGLAHDVTGHKPFELQ